MKKYYKPDANIDLLEQEDIFTASEDSTSNPSSGEELTSSGEEF